MANYILWRIPLTVIADVEVLSAELWQFDLNGLEESEDYLIVHASQSNSEAITAYIKTNFGDQVEEKIVEEENWNAKWEASFEPVTVDNFCQIRAHFHQALEGYQYDIIITPKMSFGTGHHATTRSVIRLMRSIDFNNSRVLDFGTGTGVLAILASKLGAKSVLATDIDYWCIDNAKENAEINDVHNMTLTLDVDFNSPSGQYDCIIANINRNILLQYWDQMTALLKTDGFLIISGFYEDEQSYFTNKGLQLIDTVVEQNWCAMLFGKNS
jgi:ribosomal protein L11 methyltransferase